MVAVKMAVRKDIIVLLSGEGSTFQAIFDKCKVARVVGVFSNKASANGLNRARAVGIPVVEYSNNNEDELLDHIHNAIIHGVEPELIVLAGYMKVLSADFIQFFDDRNIPIINVHPSLLPKHKGLHTHRRALEEKDEEHGMTVHYVNEELDGGPIITQRSFMIQESDTEETLTKKVKELEQTHLPRIIDALLLTIY